MAITNIATFSFVGGCVSILDSPFKPPNNPPNLMQQGLSNSITPIKFQKQEKEDQRSKDGSNYNS